MFNFPVLFLISYSFLSFHLSFSLCVPPSPYPTHSSSFIACSSYFLILSTFLLHNWSFILNQGNEDKTWMGLGNGLLPLQEKKRNTAARSPRTSSNSQEPGMNFFKVKKKKNQWLWNYTLVQGRVLVCFPSDHPSCYSNSGTDNLLQWSWSISVLIKVLTANWSLFYFLDVSYQSFSDCECPGLGNLIIREGQDYILHILTRQAGRGSHGFAFSSYAPQAQSFIKPCH